jgi:hypothetical protein
LEKRWIKRDDFLAFCWKFWASYKRFENYELGDKLKKPGGVVFAPFRVAFNAAPVCPGGDLNKRVGPLKFLTAFGAFGAGAYSPTPAAAAAGMFGKFTTFLPIRNADVRRPLRLVFCGGKSGMPLTFNIGATGLERRTAA